MSCILVLFVEIKIDYTRVDDEKKRLLNLALLYYNKLSVLVFSSNLPRDEMETDIVLLPWFCIWHRDLL